jgi:hypothetical protein
MRVKVEAYAGHTANERPLRFTLGERTVVVTEVLDRWYGEQERYFRVRAQDGDVYVLKCSDCGDRWELMSFTGRGSQGTDPRRAIDKTVH